MRRRSLLTLPAATLAAPALAQERYPNRPVTLVVGFAAGGAGDAEIRAIAEAMRPRLGVPVVVENRPGAGGTIAATRIARAPPDGYTLGLATSSPFTVAPHLQSLPYDVTRDFTFVLQYLVTPHPAYVLTQSPFQSWREMVDWARANPERLRWATAAPQGGPHIATEAAFRAEGLRTIFVPFGGGSEAITALLGRHIDLVVSADFPPLLDAGQVRLLAEIGPERVPGMEQVPTFADLGYPLALEIFFGIAGPAALPTDIVALWEDAVREHMATPEWAALMQRFRATSAFLPRARFEPRVLVAFEKIGRLSLELGLRT